MRSRSDRGVIIEEHALLQSTVPWRTSSLRGSWLKCPHTFWTRQQCKLTCCERAPPWGDNNIPVPMLSFQQSIAMGSTVFRVLLLYSVIHPRRAHVFCGPSPHAPQGSVGEGKARGGEVYSIGAGRLAPPLRHWRWSRCFSARTLHFERAAPGHIYRGGRPAASDWSTIFGVYAGDLHRVRADVNKPATLSIFSCKIDPNVCVRTNAILPEQVDPFLFFGCRRD